MLNPPRPIRKLTRVAVPIVLVLSFCGLTQAQTYWFETYQRAVELIDADRSAEAAPMLDRLLQDYPYPQSSMRIPGQQYIDYLPYFQLARIQYINEDLEAASHSLDVSEAFGAVKRNKKTNAQFVQLRDKLDSELAIKKEKPTIAAEAL